MWFVFPQVAGLGRTSTAEAYAIRSREEAVAYLGHPLLGNRIRECTAIVCEHSETPAERIFGFPDVLKFRSSMTLFAEVSGEPIFRHALDLFYSGEPDPLTLRFLGS